MTRNYATTDVKKASVAAAIRERYGRHVAQGFDALQFWVDRGEPCNVAQVMREVDAEIARRGL